MRQLLVVVAVVAILGVAVRFAPAERILPLDFSKDFPEHREHHEQLLHNLGQRPLGRIRRNCSSSSRTSSRGCATRLQATRPVSPRIPMKEGA